MGPDDFQGSSRATAVGGTESPSEDTMRAGGTLGNGGVGNSGSGRSSTNGTAGAEARSLDCATGDFRTILSRVPLCTFPPAIHPDASDCQGSPVMVYSNQTVTYFEASNTAECAEGSMAPMVLAQVGDVYGTGRAEIVTAQVLANGMVRLTCATENRVGNDWCYNFTCSANGLQTIQPNPKAGTLFVEFPELEGYEGRLDGYSWCTFNELECANRNIVYTSKFGDNASVGTEPVTYSADGKTFWFNDLSSHRVTISIDDNYQVTDVQR